MVIFRYPQMPSPRGNSLFSFVASSRLGCTKPLYWRVRMGPTATLYVLVLSVSQCAVVTSALFHPQHLTVWLVISLLVGLAMPLPTAESTQLNLLQQFHFAALKQTHAMQLFGLHLGLFFFSAQSKFSTVISHLPKKINTTLYSWENNVIEVINTENARNPKLHLFWEPCIFGIWQRNVSHCLFLDIE